MPVFDSCEGAGVALARHGVAGDAVHSIENKDGLSARERRDAHAVSRLQEDFLGLALDRRGKRQAERRGSVFNIPYDVFALKSIAGKPDHRCQHNGNQSLFWGAFSAASFAGAGLVPSFSAGCTVTATGILLQTSMPLALN